MKNLKMNYKSAALRVRFAAIVGLMLATTFFTVTAFMQEKGREGFPRGEQAIPKEEQAIPNADQFATSLREQLRKGWTQPEKDGSSKSKGMREEVTVPGPLAITATAYAFSNTSAIALEDMSSGTTQLVGPGTDDNNSSLVNIGFDYWYDGVRFTQYGVNGNGFARLGAAPTSASFTNSIATTTNAPKIMPFWDDICVGTNGSVRAKTIGSAPNRKLIVEFQNMQITRGAGCAGTGGGTFQMWLFETTGVVEFVYGSGMVATQAIDGGYSIGLQSGAATNFASVTSVTNSVSYAVTNNTQLNAITAGTAYLFTPQTANAPTAVNFAGTSALGTTVNWTDNSSNEAGFVVYRSTDGVNFSVITQTAADATSFADTNLSPSTQYFYEVRAVTEGALSAAAAGNVTTLAPGNISSTAAGGNWSAAATWVGGVVPTSADNVTIVDGATVTIDTAAVALTVTVGTGGTASVLQYEATTARTLTVGSNVSVATNGTLQSATTGTQTGHVLSLGGSLTNNGVLDFSTNANTAGAGITFTAATDSTFSGSGATTDVRGITVNKGTSFASTVELNTTNFTVQGVNSNVAGFLTLTNGTLKISGTFTMTNRIFPSATYIIPATGGIWLNNPNFNVSAQAGGTTSANNGLFRMTQGVYDIGVTGVDGLGGGTGAVFIIEGGTINATRIDPQNAVSWSQSAGIVNVGTVANTRSNFATFELFSTTSTFNMSGGEINLIQAAVAATPIDYQVLSVSTITGGTLNVGTAATLTNFNFRIRGNAPALVVDNTTNAKTATFTAQVNTFLNVTVNSGSTINTGSFVWLVIGATITNNGTILVPTSGSRFYLLGTGPQNYTGSGTCTIVTASGSVDLTMDNPAGLTIDPGSNGIVTQRVNFFRGNITNSNKLTLGNGGVTVGVLQYGLTGATVTAGNFDQAPTFNIGTGGQTILYAQEPTARTTSFEIPASRTITNSTINNSNGVIIAGGDLTLQPTIAASVLTLILGNVTTNANTLVLNSATTVSRTSGHIIGNFRKGYAALGSKTFEVGTANGYSPVTVNFTAGTFPAEFTVKAVQGQMPQISGTNALQRYWTLTPNGVGLVANLTFNYLATDVVGTAANYVFVKNNGGMLVNNIPPAAPPTTTSASINGVSAFSDWTLAESGAVLSGAFQFSSATYTDSETNSDHTFNAVVNRVGGADGDVSVDYQVTNGTATVVDNDYTVGSPTGTLVWVSGDATSRNITITVKGDVAFEPDETVNFAINNPQGGATLGTPDTAVLTITNDDVPVSAGQIIISEFRLRGTGAANDEFVELYNTTGSPHAVGATDASAGYGVVASDGVLRCTVPNGTVIPAGGHFLCTNSGAYSLSGYPAGNATTATADATYVTDIPDNVGIALFSSTTTFNLANRLDAVGSDAEANVLYKEGTGYPALTSAHANDYSFVRNPSTGVPKDTDNNVADFVFVDTQAACLFLAGCTGATADGAIGGRHLGAPSPENLSAPIQRNATVKAFVIDNGCASSSGAGPASNTTCARHRDLTSGPNATFGTLSIRRTFKNNTGASITRLRFRVVDMTTLPVGVGTADLRLLTSGTYAATCVGTGGGCVGAGSVISINGTTLETPPAQPNGGGLNSSASAGTITLGTPLAAGASINVQFLMGIETNGSYRFFINVEALP